jgi:hypothetical protein
VREPGTRGELEVEIYPWGGYGVGEASDFDVRGPLHVKFEDGQDRAEFRMEVVKDSLVEGPERFALRLRDERQNAWVVKNSEMFVTIEDSSIEVSETAEGIVVSWAAPCEGCELEFAEEAGANVWRKVDALAIEAEGRFRVNETVGERGRFYRLRKAFP